MYGLVVIGYNRVDSLKRLLGSLKDADYGGEKVDLIISLDNCGSDIVERYAERFEWQHGRKYIKTYPERLGLRRHVLTCGDYIDSGNYDALAIFEDDIFVAPTFFTFMKAAVEFYKDDENIAGISLYSHFWSEYNCRSFTPEKRRYDTYFLQYAQSWGQIWMPKQWDAFRKWYEFNNGEIEEGLDTPSHIISWPKSSWLKYHIKYCIAENKFFVYPYFSFTTNFVELGQHCTVKTTVYQVPMQYDSTNYFAFAQYGDESAVYYDAFFERQRLGDAIGIRDDQLSVNLYGGKTDNPQKRYLVTSKKVNYKIVRSYALELRPHEMNIIYNLDGQDIFLYDTSIIETNKFYKDFDLTRWYYDSRIFDYKYIIKILIKIIRIKLLKI